MIRSLLANQVRALRRHALYHPVHPSLTTPIEEDSEYKIKRRFSSSTTAMASPTNPREQYKVFLPIQLRWGDNDMYGHVNNVIYYALFDTVINEFLIAQGGLVPTTSDVVGLCVESKCEFYRPLAFPQVAEAGLYVSKIGNSSLRYEVGIFEKGEDQICAHGHFVHVFVSAADQSKPTNFPDNIRRAVESIFVPASAL